MGEYSSSAKKARGQQPGWKKPTQRRPVPPAASPSTRLNIAVPLLYSSLRSRTPLPESLFPIPVANASLRRNGEKRIGKLRQRHAQQVQLILGQLASKRIGQGSNGSCQFTRIHEPHLHTIYIGYRAKMCTLTAAFITISTSGR